MDHTTVVHRARGPRLILALGYPAAGALVGVVGGLVIEWAAQRSAGFNGILGFADRVGEPVGLLVATALGLAAGLVVAVGVHAEALRVKVSSRRIALAWDDARVSVPRSLVRQIVLGPDLVLLGDRAVELARVRCDVDRPALRRALTEHGYPTPLLADPHEHEFREGPITAEPAVIDDAQDLASIDNWYDSKDISTPADDVRRLLDARAAALADRTAGDAELLRRELAARGVMVRHRRRRGRLVQEWRRLAPQRAARPQVAEEPAEPAAGSYIVSAA